MFAVAVPAAGLFLVACGQAAFQESATPNRPTPDGGGTVQLYTPTPKETVEESPSPIAMVLPAPVSLSTPQLNAVLAVAAVTVPPRARPTRGVPPSASPSSTPALLPRLTMTPAPTVMPTRLPMPTPSPVPPGAATPATEPLSAVLVAVPRAITAGDAVQLSWSVAGASTQTFSHLGAVNSSGAWSTTPLVNTTYTLVATSSSGEQVTSRFTVVVYPQVAIRLITISPPSGCTAEILWTASGGDDATIWLDRTSDGQNQRIFQSVDSGALNGAIRNSPPGNGRYNYDVTVRNGAGQSVTASGTFAAFCAPPRIVSFVASATAVTTGEGVTLQWETADAPFVTIAPLGNVAPVGLSLAFPIETTFFNLVATNAQGRSVTASIAVGVYVEVGIVNFVAAAGGCLGAVGQAELSWLTRKGPEAQVVITRSITSASLSVTPIMVLQATSRNGSVTDVMLANEGYTYTITVTNGAGLSQSLTGQVTIAC